MASKERQLLLDLGEELKKIQESHPAWYADWEDIDPTVAERPDVERLIQTAPNEFCRGLMVGILFQRQSLGAFTGRSV